MRLFVTNRTTDNINKENLFYISKLLNSTKSHQLCLPLWPPTLSIFFYNISLGGYIAKKKTKKALQDIPYFTQLIHPLKVSKNIKLFT